MTRGALVAWIVATGALAALALHGIGRTPGAGAWPTPPECDAHRCITVEGDDDVQPLAVRQGDVRVPGGESCTLVVRRPDFEARIPMIVGDVAMIDGAIVQLLACRSEPDPRYARSRAHAVLLADPDPMAWATPAKGDIFVPYSWSADDALLDHRYGAHARPPARQEGVRDAARVSLILDGSRDQSPLVPDLRVGDTFSWGPHEARIVRIVPPDAAITGWVEVALRP